MCADILPIAHTMVWCNSRGCQKIMAMWHLESRSWTISLKAKARCQESKAMLYCQRFSHQGRQVSWICTDYNIDGHGSLYLVTIFSLSTYPYTRFLWRMYTLLVVCISAFFTRSRKLRDGTCSLISVSEMTQGGATTQWSWFPSIVGVDVQDFTFVDPIL